ncbi:NAD-dependent epimerase/dehydratase family protein [Shewanella gaetbuli]|uniref:NAD-dependent epimerase/dehydratase family protein n=1 Tax=Shewanella gaetbuli TaxID=220752 RepID=A0A9X2CFB3_9GAMM|nr:NAD-dependent epimerase/dehydratase family protein [Shewanella gaetbuli]MCL1141228.1 NAD-dependent epimerase/dehydratase family protein [Shewanella gaetbuli]
MIAAITGATGLVGTHLLEYLLDNDQYKKVYAIGRNPPQIAAHHYGIEKLQLITCQLDEIHELVLPETIDHGFCCLGTTIKQAGSQQAFIEVDQLAVVAFAKLLTAQQNPNLLLQVISALDANSNSSIFYNRVKGQMEQALTALAIPQLQIFRPSLLLGKRQDSRPLETLGQWLFMFTGLFFIGPLQKFKPIQADKLAQTMCYQAQKAQQGVAIFENKDLHQLI